MSVRVYRYAAIAVATFALQPAQAACVEGPPNQYVCSGPLPQSTTLVDGDDGVSVTVETGARVGSPGNAMELTGSGASVTVRPSVVVGDGFEGLTSVVGGDNGIVGGDGLSVENEATIAAFRGSAIFAADRDGVRVVNRIDGNIASGLRDAIHTGDGENTVIDNAGQIAAFNDAVRAGDGAVIRNRPDGKILAKRSGVVVGENAVIENEGRIAGSDPNAAGGVALSLEDGLVLRSGTVVNTGLIEGVVRVGNEGRAGIRFAESGEIDSAVTNSGVIAGRVGIATGRDTPDLENTGSQTIWNDGTITGFDGVAMALGAGNDHVQLFDSLAFLNAPGGPVTTALTLGSAGPVQVFGVTDLGADDDRLGFSNTTTRGSMIYGGVLDSLFDGGDGIDTVWFSARRGQFVAASMAGPQLVMEFSNGVESQILTLENFEFVVFGADPFTGFGGQRFAASRVALGPNAIPLPPAAWLLIGGLGALGAMARRRG